MKLDELKVLLGLYGGGRLVYLEEEIFTDVYLIEIYIDHLYKDNRFQIKLANNEINVRLGRMVYHYSIYVMKKRWFVAETFLSNQSTIWGYYKLQHFIPD